MQAQTTSLDNPYSGLICGYFQRNFPHAVKPSKTNLVDIVSDIIVGDKNLRYGSIPSPEILVNIRAVVRDAIAKDLPIPVLVPWGGRKTDPSAIVDIAEVSGLQQIILTDKSVKDFYSPGLHINMRVEDINAMWLYRKDEGINEAVEIYSSAMDNLIAMLKGSSNITSMRESRMMNKAKYFEVSAFYSNLLHQAIMKLEAGADPSTLEEMKELAHYGWKGTIDKAQRDYYLGRYKHLYGVSDYEAARLLADYFGGSKARYDLNAKGVPKSEVGGFIQANFSHPVPNAPAGLFDSTVYWRTIPMNQARTHIAPWRGKGYFKISRNDVTTKITSWSDALLNDLVTERVVISDNGLQAVIQTDFLIEQ